MENSLKEINLIGSKTLSEYGNRLWLLRKNLNMYKHNHCFEWSYENVVRSNHYDEFKKICSEKFNIFDLIKKKYVSLKIFGIYLIEDREFEG